MARGKKTGGRRPGSKNKRIPEVQAIARRFLESPAYLEMLQLRLDNGTAGIMEQLLWHYAHGKPQEPADGGHVPKKIVITF